MPSHITVVPASTQAGKETIRILLKSDSKPFVRAIYRDISKAPSEFTENPNFEAIKGDVATGSGLDFTKSEAVLFVPPPTFDGTDQGEFATKTALNIKGALERAPTVKRLVLHSATGAQHDHGIGIIQLNHVTDGILERAAPQVTIVRPPFYYDYWAQSLKAMQSDTPKIVSPFSPADLKVPMIDVRDIAGFHAKTLLDESAQPSLRRLTIFGPRHYSSLDVKAALEEVTGKQGELVVIPQAGLKEFVATQVPAPYVQEYVDLFNAFMPGGVATGDLEDGKDTVWGEIELADFFREIMSR